MFWIALVFSCWPVGHLIHYLNERDRQRAAAQMEGSPQ